MLNSMTHYQILSNNSLLNRNIEVLIKHYGLDELCSVIERASNIKHIDTVILIGNAETSEKITSIFHLKTPVRIGKLLDFLSDKQKHIHANKTFKIGPYILHLKNNTLTIDDNHFCTLTEIEVQILTLLAKSQETITSKEALLQNVWGYRPDLDTHTVETHIYRLRQKIESNPSQPAILLTQETGYQLTQ